MATLEDLDVRVDREGSLRRTRSAGEMPRHPERAHLPLNRRFPEDASLFNNPTNAYSSISHSVGDGSLLPLNLPTHSQARSQTSPAIDTHSVSRGLLTPMPTATATPHINQQEGNQSQSRPTSPPNMPFYLRLLMFLGIGRRASYTRKALASLTWNLFWGFSQIVTIIVVLILTGTHFRSTQNPELSEWTACDRPLGVWGSLWVFRASLASFLAYWEYIRHRRAYGISPIVLDIPLILFYLYLRYLLQADTEGSTQPAQTAPDYGTNSNTNGSNNLGQNENRPQSVRVPYNRTYSRLTLLSSFVTLSWVVTAQILVYTSLKTCRMTSPHLWWLLFGIICIMYLMIFEILILGIMVLIIAPILFVFWNIFLICIGRHPLQNPGIRPEIGKLPKSIVERIPLVMYIPPPPDETSNDTFQTPHSYPPKNGSGSRPSINPQRRFRFIRKIIPRSKGAKETEKSYEKEEGASDANHGPISWEENWEQGEYPFVSLEGNRASCVICLVDFEEPKRRHPSQQEHEEKAREPVAGGSDSSAYDTAVSSEPRGTNELKLTDAGEGAQPLRLLACGHVFHKTCLDPWLTDVSGRCPVCQRPVEVPKTPKRSRRHR